MSSYKCLLSLALALCVSSGLAHAGPLTIDGFVTPGDASNPDAYDAAASFSWDDTNDVLTIFLENTSTGLQDQTSHNVLTGLAFKLPENVAILGGSVMMASVNQAVGFNPVDGTDVSKEWGSDSQPLNSGAFQNPEINANLDLNTAVSSLISQTTDAFESGSLDGTPHMNGPDFGLLSTDPNAYPVNPVSFGGFEAIWGGVTITLQLSDLNMSEADLLAFIEAHDVVASFGSPTPALPEPGTFVLLGSGMVALFAFKRRRKLV